MKKNKKSVVLIGWKHKFKNSKNFQLIDRAQKGGKTNIKLDSQVNYSVDLLKNTVKDAYIEDRIKYFSLEENYYDDFFKDSLLEIGDYNAKMITPACFRDDKDNEISFWDWGKKKYPGQDWTLYLYTTAQAEKKKLSLLTTIKKVAQKDHRKEKAYPLMISQVLLKQRKKT